MKRVASLLLLVCVLAAGSAVAAEKALSYPKGNGLRIVSTGHSWVAPAMKTLSPIALAAGFDGHRQCSHLSGGSTGSARSIWAAEKGLDFPGRAKVKPGKPILLPAIETGQWDVMTFGAYVWDKPEDYANWIDVCLKANPNMAFYLQDGWPRAQDGMVAPDKYDIDKFRAAQRRINEKIKQGVDALSGRYPGRLHVIPVGDGICELLRLFLDKHLPYVQKVDSQKKPVPGIYKDGGHLDERSGLDWFEGYIYYATLYKRSPELIKSKFKVPDAELDKVFRKVAWQVVTHHPLSGVTDKNEDGVGDEVK